jgi:uncharacterized protein (DUF2336 family)
LAITARNHAPMIAVSSFLSQRDVSALARDPSADVRATTARKVAHVFAHPKITDTERKLALDVLTVMARDAEIRVRVALSQSIKDNPDIPRKMAQQLARDVGEVAVPILQFSSALTDEDLLDVIAAGSSHHQLAIARRKLVSESVSGALVERGDESVVSTLLENPAATIASSTLALALERFPGEGVVPNAMARREHLPFAIAEQLVSRVSEGLKLHLVTHHDLPPDLAADLLLESREKATVGLISDDSVGRDAATLVAQLDRSGRLTATLLLRAVYGGDFELFVHGLAQLARIPAANAYQLVRDPGQRGFAALYERCGLPENMFSPAEVAVAVAIETHYEDDPASRPRFVELAVSRLQKRFGGKGGGEEIDALLARLTRPRVGGERKTHAA